MNKMRFLFFVFVCLPTIVLAQKIATIHGQYTYEVGDNDNITLREAKLKCIELAKADAIKTAFGELITSDVIDSNVETNGEKTSSYFWENTVAKAKGNWLGDTRDPEIQINYIDGKLIFTAEVWGTAREIVQAQTDLEWKILKEGSDGKEETAQLNSGERIYVSFRSPADGYVAVYLIENDDNTSCLLPYRKNTTGRHQIKSGRDYIFFDKEVDPNATPYNLTTQNESEDNQLVIIYSPNSFTKCNDVSKNSKRPNALTTHDFQKWLLKCQRADSDMVVNKKWIRINKKS